MTQDDSPHPGTAPGKLTGQVPVPAASPAPTAAWRWPLRTLLGASMVALLIVVSATLIGLDYFRARAAALDSAEVAMQAFSGRLVDRLAAMSADAVTPVELMSSVANAFMVPPPERVSDKAAIMRVVLARSPEIDGLYAGYPDGSFFHVVSLRDEGWRKALDAPGRAEFAIRTIENKDDGGRLARATFLDETGTSILERVSEASTYDPRKRPWYRMAANKAPTVSIGPYEMATTKALGMTIAESHRQKADVVIGADIILDTIADFLAAQRMTRSTAAFIVDGDGNVIIHSDAQKMRRSTARRGAMAAEAPAKEPLAASIGPSGDPDEPARVVDVDGRKFLLNIASINKGILLNGHRIVVAAPLDELLEKANRALLQGLSISAGVVGCAILFALLLSGWITRSLLSLTSGANHLQTLDFSSPIDTSSHVSEISTLGAAMNKARSAIYTFALYVPKEFVRKGIESGHFTGRSARRQEVTALFTDIYDFTTISENYPPEDVVAMLSDYFDVFGEGVAAHNGAIIQFLGDSVYAMWNAPIVDEDHAVNACLCALAVERQLQAFNQTQKAKGLPQFRTRFGIHTGPAVVGSVGARERLQYTAMGDTINVASRLEGMNKAYGTVMLVSGAVVAKCAGRITFRPLGEAQAKGRAEALAVYEILAAVDLRVEPAAPAATLPAPLV